MTSGQPDPSSLPKATKGAFGRRGLMAGVAAATAALLTYAQGRNAEVALAVDGTFDNLTINDNINFVSPAQNEFSDIRTSTNVGGMRYYNAPTLSASPEGAAIQFWGNGSGLPGQAYIDSGAHNDAAVIFRTAPTGGTIQERVRISSSGSTTFTGDVAISGMKQFVIDHPLDPDNKYLYHSSIEGPEQYLIYCGNATTDANGQAVVSLPAYFEAINRDLRYQLTVIGGFAQATIASKVQNNQFTIRTDRPGVEVSWQVTGVRNDVYARNHPFEDERPKAGAEVGSRLHPEDYRMSPESSRGNRLSPVNVTNRPNPNGGARPNSGR